MGLRGKVGGISLLKTITTGARDAAACFGQLPDRTHVLGGTHVVKGRFPASGKARKT